MQMEKNPMKLNPIIKNVLTFLELDDLKNCRLISKEWDSAAMPMLRSRSKILFKKYSGRLNLEFTPVKFFEIFSENSETIPFTAFKIIGCEKKPWRVNELREFFERHQRFIRQLELFEIYLANENGVVVQDFDITPWISNSEIIMANTKYNTKLSIIQSLCGRLESTFSVSLGAFVNVKEVVLRGCKIVISDEIRISPVKLELTRVKFYKNGESVPEILVNSLVDFSRTKKMALDGTTQRDDNVLVSMTLDVHGNEKVAMDNLFMYGVNVINWSSSKWTVKYVFVRSMPFLQKIGMKITEFHFLCTQSQNGKVDLSALPPSIEKLSLQSDNGNPDMQIICTQPFLLPNLRYLRILTDQAFQVHHVLPFFYNCDLFQLELELLSWEDDDDELETCVRKFPKNIQRLSLKGLTADWKVITEDLSLDKLILSRCSYGDATKACNGNVHANSLVVANPWVSPEDSVDFTNFLECLNQTNRFQNVYIGPCSNLSFNQLPTDQRQPFITGQFYEFNSNGEKIITYNKFKEMFDISD